jgi:hypothetical protein
MRLRTLGVALLVACLTMPAAAQESITRAEELIRLQEVPLAMPVSFERAYSPEQVDFLAWIATRALDPTTSAWNPRHRAWALYRANVRYTVEQSLRRRWADAAGVVRSLSQNPDTALARFYADALSPQELDEALAFHRSEAGRTFVSYQRELRRVHYAGMIELDRIGIDPAYGDAKASLADRRRAWLAEKAISLDAAPSGYAFHLASARALWPSTQPDTLVFTLVAGAPPGTEAFEFLDSRVSPAHREAVTRYLASPAGEKGRQAREAWVDALARSRDLLPLVFNDLRAVEDVVVRWRKLRADPRSLPRSIAQVDPETVNVPEQYDTTDMTTGDAVATVKACAPSVSDATASALAERVRSAPASTLHALSSPGSHMLLLIRQRTAACIPTTPPGYPIPAASSFVGTIRVIGMDPAQERAWRIAIAQEIAAFGASDSLVVMRNGNGFEVNYAVNAQAPHTLVYSRRFLRKGTYDPTRYRIVQRSDQYTSVEVLQLGSGHEVRFEKALHSTPEELAREQERRNRDAKPSP